MTRLRTPVLALLFILFAAGIAGRAAAQGTSHTFL